MALIIKSGRKSFFNKKRNRLLIIKNILEKITEDWPLSIINLKIDIAFKLVWTTFIKIENLIYMVAKVKNTIFTQTSFTKLDISFLKGNQYAILYLKQSQINTECTGMQIILVVTSERTCLVAALKRLFIQNLRSTNTLFFKLQFAALFHQGIVNILNQCVIVESYFITSYCGHSFEKRAAQHIINHGMLDKRIQRLGYYKSNAIKLYFITILKTLFYLNLYF